MKAIEQDFTAVHFFCAVQDSPFLGSVDEPLTSMLHKWVLTLKCRNGILKCDRSNERN